MKKLFQKSVVAFIDILGFTEVACQEEKSEILLNILRTIKSIEKPKGECSIQESSGGVTNISIWPTISAFSDHIVISVSEDMFENSIASWRHAVIEILNKSQMLAFYLLQQGFLFRGGLTIGNLYHEEGIVFGEALIEAYKLESKTAKNPRIVVSEKLLKCYNDDENPGSFDCFLKDKDGKSHLNYLAPMLQMKNNEDQEKLSKIIDAEIEKISEKKILRKWQWFKDYYKAQAQAKKH